jgi:hypothetical protein
MSIALCWVISLTSYFFYLTRQKSVLNTWPKPNELSDLLASYNDSIMIITIIIPCLAFIISTNSIGETDTLKKGKTNCLRPIAISSLLWLSVPLIFWIISHLSSLNLFVDRYFIPKESAMIFLMAYGFNLILQKLPPKDNLLTISMLGTFALSVVLFLVSTKRKAFALNKDTNYHHSLIIEETYPESEQPIILDNDPMYLPNAYLGKNNYFFAIKEHSTAKIYKTFSSKMQITTSKK